MHVIKLPLAVLIILSLAACVTPREVAPKNVPVEARGTAAATPTGCNQLVPIFAADMSEARVRQQAWIARNEPGATVTGRRAADCAGDRIEVLTLATATGKTRTVWFDLSSLDNRAQGGARDLQPGPDGA